MIQTNRLRSRLPVLAIVLTLLLLPLLLSGCTNKTTLATVGDAENVLFTNDGRMFITGGTNIFELTSTELIPQLPEGGNHCGIVQAGNYIYAIQIKTNLCGLLQPLPMDQLLQPGGADAIIKHIKDSLSQSVLLRAEYHPGKLDFQEIYTFPNMLIANGMVTDGQGHLFVADETIAPGGKIVRLTLAGDIPQVVDEKVWLSGANGVSSPNGMAIRDNCIYFTDFHLPTLTGSVKKVAIQPNGDPGSILTLYTRHSLFDDLDCGDYKGMRGVAAADFIRGSVVFLKDNGTRRWWPDGEIAAGTFQSPSSVHMGQPPMFTNQDLIVTEKGIMFDNVSGIGNKVTRVTAN